MVQVTKVHSKTIKDTARVYILGLICVNTMETGNQGNVMDMEHALMKMVAITRDIS